MMINVPRLQWKIVRKKVIFELVEKDLNENKR
jgi:hypothetical protein